MTPHAEPFNAAERSSARPGIALAVHGLLAGLVGAATLAIWFLWLDWGRGRPLFTPTVLGLVLFEGGRGLESVDTLEPSLRLTLAFTAVHGFVFMVMGFLAARLVALTQRRRSLVLIVVVMFVLLQIAFIAFRMTFVAVTAAALEWPEVVFGNVVAATAMITYLWRRQPERTPQAR